MTTDVRSGPLALRFGRHLQESALLHDTRCVLVAVSGGLDSICLLHLLRFGRFELDLEAAHYDHAMRAGSAADAAWVRGVCTAWEVPLRSARAATPPRSEAAARELRYAFLQDVAARSGAIILTAHHADDQAETVLFRMARGTGVTGLVGIPARRGNIARPLLPFTRQELSHHAGSVGLRWREDVTNRELRFARNRIRHVVLPALETIRPGAARRIARLADRVADAESAWQVIVEDAVADVVAAREDAVFVLARDRLLAYHPHVRARVLRHLLSQLGLRLDRSGTAAAVEFISSGTSGGRLELAGGIRLEREFERVLIEHARVRPEPADVPLEIPSVDPGSGTFVAGGQRYAANWAPASLDVGVAYTASFDPSSLRFPLALRAWRPGDRMRLPYGSKKLKKLLQERRVGRTRRTRVAVLSDAVGAVLWAVGLARSVEAPPRQGAVFTITVTDGEPQRRA
jgi:tRNA(Ile)-lysidine synthase